MKHRLGCFRDGRLERRPDSTEQRGNQQRIADQRLSNFQQQTMRTAFGLQAYFHEDDRDSEQDADGHDGCNRYQSQTLAAKNQLTEWKSDVTDIGIAGVQTVNRRIRQMMAACDPVDQRAAEYDDDANRKRRHKSRLPQYRPVRLG